MTLLEPNAFPWTQSYGYDAAERLTSVVSPAGSFGYAYDSTRVALPGTLTLPSGATIATSYDFMARLTNTTLRSSQQAVLNHHGYGYNAASQRTSVTNMAGNTVAYTYDRSGQLVQASGKEAGGTTRLNEQFGYGYNAAGNLALRTNNGFAQTFTLANGFNQLDSVSRSGTFTAAGLVQSAINVTVTVKVNAEGSGTTVYADKSFARAGITLIDGTNAFTAVATDSNGRLATNAASAWLPATASFVHDKNGNLTSDGRRGFGYDDFDQLTSVTVTNAWRSEFKYDALGRRRVRTEKVWKNSQWVTASETRYVYDHMLVIQERDALNLPTATYTRGLDLSGGLQRAGGIGGLLALTLHSSLPTPHFYYHADAGGNVTTLTDSRQAVVARYRYDPFGNLLGLSGPMAEANPYRFSSKEFHVNSGLYYYGYRFYEPSLQRWLNRDPIEEAGGLNLYGYVGNDPIGSHDPLGYERYPYVVLPGGRPKFDPTPAQEPTILEGLIPVVGPYRQAVYDAENGRWGWALLNTALAGSDAVPLRSALGGVCRGAWKSGSTAWRRVRDWLGRRGYLEPGQEGHHWCIPRNDWGKRIPNSIKNQPWNIYGMPNPTFHDAIHGAGPFRLNLAERVWHGSPPWFRAALFSTAGREFYWFFGGADSLAPVLPPPFAE